MLLETDQTRLESMWRMRQSGATLKQIGKRKGISRQRVGRLLALHYRSTRIEDLITSAELASHAGCTPNYILKLKRLGVIQPARVVGRGRALWKPETVAATIIYIDRCRCAVCQRPLPSNRGTYCSAPCYRWRYQKRWAERHGSTESVVRRKCLIPLGTVVRVVSYHRALGLIKVDWDGQILELPFGSVERIAQHGG